MLRNTKNVYIHENSYNFCFYPPRYMFYNITHKQQPPKLLFISIITSITHILNFSNVKQKGGFTSYFITLIYKYRFLLLDFPEYAIDKKSIVFWPWEQNMCSLSNNCTFGYRAKMPWIGRKRQIVSHKEIIVISKTITIIV